MSETFKLHNWIILAKMHLWSFNDHSSCTFDLEEPKIFQHSCKSFVLMIEPGEFHADTSWSAPVVSHVTLSLGEINGTFTSGKRGVWNTIWQLNEHWVINPKNLFRRLRTAVFLELDGKPADILLTLCTHEWHTDNLPIHLFQTTQILMDQLLL